MAHRMKAKLIQRHFGKHAKVRRKLFGGFNVTTPGGGDIDISDEEFTIHSGGEEVYRSVVSLASEAWGGLTVWGGADHVMATIAHADALGTIQVTPVVKDSGDGCLRFVIAIFLLSITSSIIWHFAKTELQQLGGIALALFFTLAINRLIKKSQERAERRRGQKYRHLYPTVHGGKRDADREDADRQGWL